MPAFSTGAYRAKQAIYALLVRPKVAGLKNWLQLLSTLLVSDWLHFTMLSLSYTAHHSSQWQRTHSQSTFAVYARGGEPCSGRAWIGAGFHCYQITPASQLAKNTFAGLTIGYITVRYFVPRCRNSLQLLSKLLIRNVAKMSIVKWLGKLNN